MMARPAGADLTGQSLITWKYACAAAGTSALTYEPPGSAYGTLLSTIDGLPIPAALVGDSITCVTATASTNGLIALQGRLSGAPLPAGWNDAAVTFTCVSGGCMGYGPYTFGTNAAGEYQLIKGGAGAGIPLGTYSVTAVRRAYLGATKASNVTIVAGLNPIGPTPTLLGGDVNASGNVGIEDLTAVGGAFGTSITPDTGPDINGDGFVNVFDLALAGGNYEKTTSVWP
jgi:hypothetical protein